MGPVCLYRVELWRVGRHEDRLKVEVGVDVQDLLGLVGAMVVQNYIDLLIVRCGCLELFEKLDVVVRVGGVPIGEDRVVQAATYSSVDGYVLGPSLHQGLWTRGVRVGVGLALAHPTMYAGLIKVDDILSALYQLRQPHCIVLPLCLSTRLLTLVAVVRTPLSDAIAVVEAYQSVRPYSHSIAFLDSCYPHLRSIASPLSQRLWIQ